MCGTNHLGNFALWLAGVFPDHITHRVQRRGAPPLSYYDEMGAAGFRSAATMDMAVRQDVGELFLTFADHFCTSATNEIAINWNAPLVYLAVAVEGLMR